MLPLPSTIMFMGRFCAGKDEFGKRLIPHGYTKLAFADPLKVDVARKHRITPLELEARKGEFRQELQEYGESRRQEDPDYWLNRWLHFRQQVDGPVVCTDCRHINESFAGLVHGWVVKVITPEPIRRARASFLYGEVPEARFNHVSETHIDLAMYHTLIPGTLPDYLMIPRLLDLYRDIEAMGFPVSVSPAAASGYYYDLAVAISHKPVAPAYAGVCA